MSLQRPPPLYQQIANALREDIRSGRYRPGDRLPSVAELQARFGVSKVTARQAVVQLRAERLVTSRVGEGVFVAEKGAPRRMSDDILHGDALYKAMDRLGLQPDVATTITREPATEEVAEALDVAVGAEVLVHVRLVRAEGGRPLFLATNYFPAFVAEAVPQLAEPSPTVGLTKRLSDAFGPLYGADEVDARMPTPEERERLEVPEGVPVSVIRGINRDSQHRTLHHIVKVTPSGRFPPVYRFGDWPEG
jgi:GntR family transcriptional regulator